MNPSGDLLPLAETLLKSAGLAVRCPNRPGQCLTTPLTFEYQDQTLTVRCQCWQIAQGAGVYKFTKSPATPAAVEAAN